MSRLDRAFDSPDAKRRYVRRLFTTIADRYDLITTVLSYGLDRRWKRRAIGLAEVSPRDLVLDLACGTGDLAHLAAARGASVVGLDLTHRMLQLARDKPRPGLVAPIRWTTGDMSALPHPSGSFTVVTTGYGLRNVPDLDQAIREAARVLSPGGRFVSLDFNRPSHPVVRAVYLAYLTVTGSLLGWLLHGDPDTYRYIPASIRRYPGADGVAERLRHHGFAQVRLVPVLGGLMTIHVARRG